jgi:amidophosphoribosyltransferase
VRYPTAGSEGMDEAQPFYVNSPYGIALAHNGNLINTEALRQQVFEQDRRNVNTDSDSEVLLNVFAYELEQQRQLSPEAAIRAVAGVHRRCKGGYAVVSVVLGLGLVAFRDPHGIRPLVLGKRSHAEGDEYIVASESAALDVLGFQRVRDVQPGEALVITARGELFSEICAEPAEHTPCIFEYVYCAPGFDDRQRLGAQGAHAHGHQAGREDPAPAPGPRHRHHHPDPGYLARCRAGDLQRARGEVPRRLHQEPLHRPHLHHAGPGRRVKSVRRKLNPIHLEFRNRVVLLVDDSIVRGTTSQQIVQMARDAGRARSTWPARHRRCATRTSTASTCRRPKLVAHNRTVEEIEAHLGCDWLIYQDLEDMEAAVSEGNPALRNFDSSCFNGHYPTGIEPGYFERIQQLRSDDAKHKRRA